MDLQLKDWLTIGVSALALLVAATSFYYANVHKPAAAKLTLLGRSQDAEVVAVKIDEKNLYIQHRKIISKARTNLSYSLSNTGKQALCVKSVEVLRGPSKSGNLRDSRPFLPISSPGISSFVLEPGDIKILEVGYDDESDSQGLAENKYRLLSLELVSADGSRYQVCHDITNVMSIVSLHDPLWDGVSLGGPVRSEGYI
ncbi:hypothetical protein ACYZTM_01870 [Pseudomonas sp. MDT2-39-1]